MAATGFTPIQLYRTTTPAAQPLAANLADGELAINTADKKLYAKDSAGAVFLLADASSGGTTATNLAGGAAGSVPYQTGANATTFLGIGAAGQVLQVNSGGTAPEWGAVSGTVDVARTTSPSFTTPDLGAATGLSLSMTGQSLTGSSASSILGMSTTWNTTGTPTAIFLDVTDTASNANSLLLDLQTGGTSKFRVTKTGSVRSLGKTISLTDGTYEIFLERAPSGYSAWGGRLFFLEGEIKWGLSAYLSFIGTGATSKWLFNNSGITAASGGIGVFASHTGSLGFQTYGSTTDYAAIASAHTDNSNSGLIFRAKSAGTTSEAARITSGGNVGIGTTSPAGTGQRIVQIAGVGGGVNQYGSLSLSNASGSGNNLLGSIDYYAASTLISAIRSVVTASGNTGDLRFFSASGGSLQQRAVIDSSGITVGLANGTVGGFLTAYNAGSASERTGLFIGNGATPAGSNISINLASLANDGQYYNLAKIIGFKTAGGSTTVSGGLIFSTNDNSAAATERMRLDQFGNLGLGVTPGAWASARKALQIGQSGVLAASTNSQVLDLVSNAIVNSAGNTVYLVNGFASYYRQFDSVHTWAIAASGTAGNAISFTQAMTLNASGNLLIGTTSDAGFSERVNISGRLAISDGSRRIGFSEGAMFINGSTNNFTNGQYIAVSASNVLTISTRISSVDTQRIAVPAAGGMVVGTAALATTATDGFLYVPTCAGTPTGTPTAQTGTAPIVIDTTNNKLYFYSGGQWRDAGP